MQKCVRQIKPFHFIGRLRITLIIMVILHHCAILWTGGNWWPVITQNKTIHLDGFMAVNYSCGMGLFFLISAFFHPVIIDRYGPIRFIKTRLLKLGVPLLIYLFCIVPFIMYAYYLNFRSYGYIPFWRYYLYIYLGAGERPPNWTGPHWGDAQLLQFWFTQHLLFYGMYYAVLRMLAKKLKIPWMKATSLDKPMNKIVAHLGISTYIVTIAVAYFLIRIYFPIYKWIGMFGAIQVELAKLPQYIGLFGIGLIAGRRNWFLRLPSSVGYVWLCIGVTLSAFMYVGLLQRIIPFTLGGADSDALAYASLDALLGTSLCVGFITLFREKFNFRLSKFTRALARNVYCVFIIHVPIVVSLHYCLYKSTLPPILLFITTAVIAIPASFAASHYFVRRIPGANAVL